MSFGRPVATWKAACVRVALLWDFSLPHAVSGVWRFGSFSSSSSSFPLFFFFSRIFFCPFFRFCLCGSFAWRKVQAVLPAKSSTQQSRTSISMPHSFEPRSIMKVPLMPQSILQKQSEGQDTAATRVPECTPKSLRPARKASYRAFPSRLPTSQDQIRSARLSGRMYEGEKRQTNAGR